MSHMKYKVRELTHTPWADSRRSNFVFLVRSEQFMLGKEQISCFFKPSPFDPYNKGGRAGLTYRAPYRSIINISIWFLKMLISQQKTLPSNWMDESTLAWLKSR